MLPPEFVYRALTKEATPSDKSFRLRPNESFLSIAATKEKAIGTLVCKGWAKLDSAKVAKLGLEIRGKTSGQVDPPDPDLLEVVGVPTYGSDDQRIQDIAIGLAGCVVESGTVSKRSTSTA